MATKLAIDLLNEVFAAFNSTTVTISDVKQQMTDRHVSAVCRYGKSVSRGIYDFASVLNTESSTSAPVEVKVESDSEIDARLRDRFEALDVMTHATAIGINRALIVSGAPGLGKSFGIEKKLEELDDIGAANAVFVKGYVRPLSMYRLLWENRSPNSVVVFDDADSVFGDDVALNILKAACDSSDVRRISWMSESDLEDSDGNEMPKTFEFEGSIIFITNMDFTAMIARGNRLAPHFQALESRALYLDLGLKTARDYYVRVQQVVSETTMLDSFTENEKAELLMFIEENQNRFRDFSLRMVKKLSAIYRMDSKNWKRYAFMTLCK